MMVHLAREDDAPKMLKRGIRSPRGVFCLPILPNYFISHQWLRELKRRGSKTLVAVHFRLPDDEPVLVGRYNSPHESVTLTEAIRRIRESEDAQGFEIIVPRSIEAKEVERIRDVSQVTGWRFFPGAKGRKPCFCRYCSRGEIKSGKRWRERDPLVRAPGAREVWKRLSDAVTEDELEDALHLFNQKWRRGPERLAWLMSNSSERVLVALVFALASFRGKEARAMLERLAKHPMDEVAQAAREELSPAEK